MRSGICFPRFARPDHNGDLDTAPASIRVKPTMPAVLAKLAAAAACLASAAHAGAVASHKGKLALRGGDAARATTAPHRQPPADHSSGAAVAISQDGLNFACQQVLEPLLEKELNALTFPDINTEEAGIKVHLDNLRTHDFKCDGCVKATLEPGSGLRVELHGFEIMLHSR